MLDINKEKQEISLGMKQTEVNPWTLVEEKYPPGTVIEGTVRNLTNYGAFVEIEEGIDGLLHVSDMSWTKKVSHPSEMLKKGETVEAVVLSVDQEKKRVALGLKQLERGPVADARSRERYTPGARSSRARSPRSPTSASSSSWRTASKACCTSPSCADHKLHRRHARWRSA